MRKLKILLIGQPNVGKSSLLNALVGPKVIVSNYPGTTVEVARAEKVLNNTRTIFVDTPGIYSISDRSEEEKVTEKALFEETIDGVIVIADAVSLERSLYMVLQILETGIPLIVTLNFVEEAEKKGIKIDCQKLGELLNVPVVSINPLTRKGIQKLIDLLLNIKKERRGFRIEYDDHIEKAINKISLRIKETKLPKRFVATRILEEDEDFYKYLENREIIDEIKKLTPEHPKLTEDVSITRYGTASFIAEKVTQIIPLKKKKELGEKIDKILLDKTWGPIVTGLSILVIFVLLLYLGNLIESFLIGWTERFLSSFGESNSALDMILSQGLTGLAAGVSIALPYVFLFYLILGVLEDVGILSRFIVNAKRFLQKLSLPAKSFIPLALGLGCTAPAIRATRLLANKKEQFYCSSFFGFIPCSSRLGIVMGIVGFYGSWSLAFSVLATLIIAGLIWAFLIKKIIPIKAESFLLELPPYRKPLVKNILYKSWIRMKDFVQIVIPFLLIGGMVYGLLDLIGVTKMIIEPLSPITAWLGLPAATIIPLTFGFLQKDLTGAMLISVLGSKISLVLTPLQLYTFGVASTLGIPCIIAMGMLWKEFNLKKAIILTGTSIIYGFLLAGLILRIILIL